MRCVYDGHLVVEDRIRGVEHGIERRLTLRQHFRVVAGKDSVHRNGKCRNPFALIDIVTGCARRSAKCLAAAGIHPRIDGRSNWGRKLREVCVERDESRLVLARLSLRQFLLDVCVCHSGPSQRHKNMIEKIGPLFESALPVAIGTRNNKLRSLFSNLLEPNVAIA